MSKYLHTCINIQVKIFSVVGCEDADKETACAYMKRHEACHTSGKHGTWSVKNCYKTCHGSFSGMIIL